MHIHNTVTVDDLLINTKFKKNFFFKIKNHGCFNLYTYINWPFYCFCFLLFAFLWPFGICSVFQSKQVPNHKRKQSKHQNRYVSPLHVCPARGLTKYENVFGLLKLLPENFFSLWSPRGKTLCQTKGLFIT